MVISQKIFSPQQYLKAVTGEEHIVLHRSDMMEKIHCILKEAGIENENQPIQDYAFEDCLMAENPSNRVVLVDISYYGEEGSWIRDYRWFDVTDNFNEEIAQ